MDGLVLLLIGRDVACFRDLLIPLTFGHPGKINRFAYRCRVLPAAHSRSTLGSWCLVWPAQPRADLLMQAGACKRWLRRNTSTGADKLDESRLMASTWRHIRCPIPITSYRVPSYSPIPSIFYLPCPHSMEQISMVKKWPEMSPSARGAFNPWRSRVWAMITIRKPGSKRTSVIIPSKPHNLRGRGWMYVHT